DLDLLDAGFPFLKREASGLMETPYPDTQSAGTAIEKGLISFYETHYPEKAKTGSEKLRSMSAIIFDAYQKNIFPETKTDWRSTPDHIGHKYYPGCFRCHDALHVSADGSRIERRCDLCHEFLESRAIEGSQALVHGDYHHPYPLEGTHGDINCCACHKGGPTPPPDCSGCHGEIHDFMAGASSTLLGVSGNPHPHLKELECIDCHEEPRPIARDEILPLCMNCHDEDEHTEGVKKGLTDFDAARDRISEEIRSSPDGDSAEWARSASAVMKAIDRAGPVHNLDYAIKALQALDEKRDKK
ncbi:MAG: cytochrome c3 family protein, partial [Planctomycetes bacterium]|nr:cytochrome c3 family protein [Planctomycetota bacterium]